MDNFISVLAVLSSTGSLSTSACSPGSYPIVVPCFSSYLNHFNLTLASDLTVPSYSDFLAARKKRGGNDVAADFINFCDIQNAFTSCLGDGVQCMNPTDLSSIFRFNGNDKYNYANDYSISSYECTTAYDYVIRNFHCLSTIDALGKGDIQNCVTVYEANIPKEGICPAANDYITCIDNIYSSFCGKEAGDFGCNVVTRSFELDIPSCDNQLIKCNPLS